MTQRIIVFFISLGVFATATRKNALLGVLFGERSTAVKYYGTERYEYVKSLIPVNLRKITITEPCTNIGYGAFDGCSMINEISIPNSVTSIGTNAFGGCRFDKVTTSIFNNYLISSSLQKLTITSTCTSIPSGVLSACSNLEELTLPFIGTNPTNPTSLRTLFSGNVPSTLKKLTLVRSSAEIQIADDALSGCSNLIELTLSSNMKGLGENALYGCSGLRHIYSHWAYPPVAYNNNTFQGVNKFACTLYVPVGSKQYYSLADGWKEFFSPVDNIQEEAAVSIIARSVPLYGGVISGLLQYNYDAEAKLMATGNMGYNFQGWMENNQIVSTNREYTFTVEGPRTLYAIFTPRENADENVQIQTQANRVSISWVAVEDAANYTLIIYSDESRTQEIARFQLDVNGNVLRGTTRDLSCSISDLNLATTYYYSLTSYNSDNQALTISNGNFTTSTSGIDVLFVNNQISIYPNPVSESFRISGITKPVVVTLLDITGKIVLQQTVISDELVVVSHLQNGIYLVNVQGKTLKILVRRDNRC